MIPQLFLQKPPKGHLRPGHPWIYATQLVRAGVQILPGSLVDVMTDRGRFIGRGYGNLDSQIAVRLLSREAEEIDQEFIACLLH